MPFATNGHCRLYWRWNGARDRPPLLLLSSIGTDLGLWDRVIAQLSSRFGVLRMDCRGHGASDAPPGDYTLDLLATDAQAVMTAAGIESAFVCGISLGGMIAMTLALQAPARVRGLILACTSAQMDRGLWQRRLDAVTQEGTQAIADMALQRFFSEAFRKTHPQVVESVRTALLGMDSAGYAGCCAAIRDMSILAALGEIKVPTRVIAGAQDVSTPFEGHGALIVKAIAGPAGELTDEYPLVLMSILGLYVPGESLPPPFFFLVVRGGCD